MNALAGSERAVVTTSPAPTRDRWMRSWRSATAGGGSWTPPDSATGAPDPRRDFYASLRTQAALEKAVWWRLVLLDASEPLAEQDTRVS